MPSAMETLGAATTGRSSTRTASANVSRTIRSATSPSTSARNWRSSTLRGALPGRKPRSFTRRERPTYARSSSFATRSGSTSMVTFRSTGETVSTWIFMCCSTFAWGVRESR